ncbi:transposable element Tcb2 transposase [Trichonephila clavipes]|nr:transposable element Tcb2 transposase [Trichonephila clavipes]
MMEAGWSAGRVAHQLGRSDCIVRRCWDQWIRAMSFTLKPSSGSPRQTSRREDRHIVRNARVQTTASSAAVQEQNQVVCSDDSRFNLSSDGNHVWIPRGERLNPALALQLHNTAKTGVMVRGAIAYNTRSPLVLMRGTMRAQWYVPDILQPHVLPLMQRLTGAIFQKDNAQVYTAKASHEFERTSGKATTNVERNVSRHPTEHECLNAGSHRALVLEGVQQDIKSSVLLPFL